MATSFSGKWSALSATEKEALATELSCSVGYLSNLAWGHKRPSDRFHRHLELVLGMKHGELKMPRRKGVPGRKPRSDRAAA